MTFHITEDCKGCGHCVQWCPTGAIMGRRRVHYTIDSSRCIDCGVCGRICNYSAVVLPDGQIARQMRRSQWSRPHWDYSVCNNCDLCQDACPVHCIMTAHSSVPYIGLEAGFPYLSRPRICIGCGKCSDACPVEAIQLKPAGLAVSSLEVSPR